MHRYDEDAEYFLSQYSVCSGQYHEDGPLNLYSSYLLSVVSHLTPYSDTTA